MLTLNKVTKRYGSKIVLNQVSYRFANTGLYIIQGENGSGKSTLLSILSGKDGDFEGALLFNKAPVNKKTRNDYADRFVTYIPQDSFVLEGESVLDNVLIPYSKKDKKKAGSLLGSLGLRNNLFQNTDALSAGEKQRLSFARALYGLKDILLLDETTSNLDKEVLRLLSIK